MLKGCQCPQCGTPGYRKLIKGLCPACYAAHVAYHKRKVADLRNSGKKS